MMWWRKIIANPLRIKSLKRSAAKQERESRQQQQARADRAELVIMKKLQSAVLVQDRQQNDLMERIAALTAEVKNLGGRLENVEKRCAPSIADGLTEDSCAQSLSPSTPPEIKGGKRRKRP